MNQLFIKQEFDSTITKEQFLDDMDCLFENLREAYGMYDNKIEKEQLEEFAKKGLHF